MGRGLLIALALWSTPGPFTLVNGTGGPLGALSIRMTNEKGAWRPLGPGLAAGARALETSPGGEDCAFDIRAESAGKTLVWTAVNLCDVRVVTLSRGRDGTLWVDYD
ncbi:hypothetical protein GCM10022280_10870 [Sphingomonas swuensis]|uniref:Uncharacterized protein n=1 Tax=Sphingomonas swuensis TaxID=977800 RepID=A0ABP7SNU5_9SPHN